MPAKFLLSGCFRLNDVSVAHACETAVQRRRSKPPPPIPLDAVRRKLGRGIGDRDVSVERWGRERERERDGDVSGDGFVLETTPLDNGENIKSARDK